MTNLKTLHARKNCGIADDSIKDLKNIIKLGISFNKKITDVNHLTKLYDLDASDNCGLDDEGIKDLKNITRLRCSKNPKIIFPYVREI